MIRASFFRALAVSAALAGVLALAGCYGGDSYQLPTKAMKELSPQMLALLEQKNMPKDTPILIRIFKEESELEVWKQDTTGRFKLLKVYPICRWSGDLGPKIHEGDRQAPEGFYTITPGLMNPNSNYYLAINTGFPNAYDKANGRTGAMLMIHGDCSSRGCYAMTDEQIGEIYSLARDSFLGGQQSFQLQAYPFRMTPLNMARHRTNPNMAFWRMIKEGYDHFAVTHLEPKVEVCNRHYVFDAKAPASTKPLVFNASGRCPAYVVEPKIASLALEKEHNDEAQYAQLIRTVPAAPIRSGLDGGMNRVFLVQVGGSLPLARVPSPFPPQPPPVATADAGGEPTLANRLLGGLFGSKPATQPARVAASEPPRQRREVELTGASAAPKLRLASSKREPYPAAAAKAEPPHARPEPQQAVAPKAKPPAQRQEANAAAPPLALPGVMGGAQRIMPAGTFESRWEALR